MDLLVLQKTAKNDFGANCPIGSCPSVILFPPNSPNHFFECFLECCSKATTGVIVISKFHAYRFCSFHVLCEKAFRDALMAMAFDGSFSRWVTYREIRKWCKV
ncbi:hypothetical protein T4C_10357 [Trichinella pseudospiralis]|uniref:Uncharacterized protein n=2 Tax=Trichinella pseudospiralis TaxID=6337 RepID=A0A0V1JIS9_TRIPS|nr:hypothetical protein T4C_10357 [Trichinella pseudospiralis]